MVLVCALHPNSVISYFKKRKMITSRYVNETQIQPFTCAWCAVLPTFTTL